MATQEPRPAQGHAPDGEIKCGPTASQQYRDAPIVTQSDWLVLLRTQPYVKFSMKNRAVIYMTQNVVSSTVYVLELDLGLNNLMILGIIIANRCKPKKYFLYD